MRCAFRIEDSQLKRCLNMRMDRPRQRSYEVFHLAGGINKRLHNRRRNEKPTAY